MSLVGIQHFTPSLDANQQTSLQQPTMTENGQTKQTFDEMKDCISNTSCTTLPPDQSAPSVTSIIEHAAPSAESAPIKKGLRILEPLEEQLVAIGRILEEAEQQIQSNAQQSEVPIMFDLLSRITEEITDMETLCSKMHDEEQSLASQNRQLAERLSFILSRLDQTKGTIAVAWGYRNGNYAHVLA